MVRTALTLFILMASYGHLTWAAEMIASKYLIIDISEGPNAKSYPVYTSNNEPEDGFNNDFFKLDKIVLRRIPAGTYVMGTPKDNPEYMHKYTPGKQWIKNEFQHTVTISKAFYCSMFEITQEQYERVVNKFPSREGTKANAAAERITWNDARGGPYPGNPAQESFIGKLKKKTGIAFDLPTEEQWEYSCRAGTTTAYNNGTGTTNAVEDPNLIVLGWHHRQDKLSYTVGSLLPNAWDLYDMHGNVQEWCVDIFRSYPGDPNKFSHPDLKNIRGGSVPGRAPFCRSGHRGGAAPNTYSHMAGIRLIANNAKIEKNNIKYPVWESAAIKFDNKNSFTNNFLATLNPAGVKWTSKGEVEFGSTKGSKSIVIFDKHPNHSFIINRYSTQKVQVDFNLGNSNSTSDKLGLVLRARRDKPNALLININKNSCVFTKGAQTTSGKSGSSMPFTKGDGTLNLKSNTWYTAVAHAENSGKDVIVSVSIFQKGKTDGKPLKKFSALDKKSQFTVIGQFGIRAATSNQNKIRVDNFYIGESHNEDEDQGENPTPDNKPPVAVATSSANTGQIPFEVAFEGIESSDPDGTIVSYEWDFPDGEIKEGSVVTHTFTEAGSYDVILTVTDDQGAMSSSTVTIEVSAPTTSTTEIRFNTATNYTKNFRDTLNSSKIQWSNGKLAFGGSLDFVKTGTLYDTTPGNATSINAFKDNTVQVDFNLGDANTLNDQFGLLLRVRKSDNRGHCIVIKRNNYSIRRTGDADDGKIKDSLVLSQGNGSIELKPHTWYTLIASAKNQGQDVIINAKIFRQGNTSGTPLERFSAKATDSLFNAAGQVGFLNKTRKANNQILVDNFIIK